MTSLSLHFESTSTCARTNCAPTPLVCVFQTGFQYLLGLACIYQEGYSYKERFVIVRDYEVTEDGC